MTYTIFGIFEDGRDAEDAVSELESAGYNPKDISVVMKDGEEKRQFESNTGTNVAGGAATGATTGAVIGGIAGLLIGIGAIAIPGIGAVLIGGPLAAALGLSGAAATTVTGAVTGAVAGGLVGALTGLGVPESDARAYEEKVNKGGILLAVPALDDEVDDVRSIMEDCGADQIRSVTIPSSDKLNTDREPLRHRHVHETASQRHIRHASA